MQYILIIKFLKLQWSFTRIQTVHNLYHNNASKKYCNQFIFYVDISTQYIRYYYILLNFYDLLQHVKLSIIYTLTTLLVRVCLIFNILFIFTTPSGNWKCFNACISRWNFFDFWMIFASFMHNSCLQS